MKKLLFFLLWAIPLSAVRPPDPMPVASVPNRLPPVDTTTVRASAHKGSEPVAFRSTGPDEKPHRQPSPARHFWRTVGKVALFLGGVQLLSGTLYATMSWLVGNAAFSWAAFLTAGAVATGVIGGSMLLLWALMGIWWKIRRKRDLHHFRAVPAPSVLWGNGKPYRNRARSWLITVLLILTAIVFLLFGGLYALVALLFGASFSWATFSLVGGIGAAVVWLTLLVLLILLAMKARRGVKKIPVPRKGS